MVRPDEALLMLGPPDRRFFCPGCPEGNVGDAGRDKFLGVVEAVVVSEG